VDHERNYFSFDGAGDTVGRPQTMLMRSWQHDQEQQAQQQHVAARLSPPRPPPAPPSRTATSSCTPPPPPAEAYLKNCDPSLCPPSFRPAGTKRFTLSPDKPPPPHKEYERELWTPNHTRIVYMKTAKPSRKPPPPRAPTALPAIDSPAVSPQKAHQQLKQQLQQQQQQHQRLREAAVRFPDDLREESSGGVQLTRDGAPRKDYVAEVGGGGGMEGVAGGVWDGI